MLAGEMTPETLAVEVNPQVNSPLPEVRPIETTWGERDGERATGGSHPEHWSDPEGRMQWIGPNLEPGWLEVARVTVAAGACTGLGSVGAEELLRC